MVGILLLHCAMPTKTKLETTGWLWSQFQTPSFEHCRLQAENRESETAAINPLRPNSDLSQTSHCNFKGFIS